MRVQLIIIIFIGLIGNIKADDLKYPVYELNTIQFSLQDLDQSKSTFKIIIELENVEPDFQNLIQLAHKVENISHILSSNQMDYSIYATIKDLLKPTTIITEEKDENQKDVNLLLDLILKSKIIENINSEISVILHYMDIIEEIKSLIVKHHNKIIPFGSKEIKEILIDQITHQKIIEQGFYKQIDNYLNVKNEVALSIQKFFNERILFLEQFHSLVKSVFMKHQFFRAAYLSKKMFLIGLTSSEITRFKALEGDRVYREKNEKIESWISDDFSIRKRLQSKIAYAWAKVSGWFSSQDSEIERKQLEIHKAVSMINNQMIKSQKTYKALINKTESEILTDYLKWLTQPTQDPAFIRYATDIARSNNIKANTTEELLEVFIKEFSNNSIRE